MAVHVEASAVDGTGSTIAVGGTSPVALFSGQADPFPADPDRFPIQHYDATVGDLPVVAGCA